VIRNKSELLRDEAWRGVGAGVVVTPDSRGLRSGLRVHFEGFGPEEGPYFRIAPSGLRRHTVTAEMGRFAKPCIEQMKMALPERVVVARALVRQLAASHDLEIAPHQSVDGWSVTGGDFRIKVTVMDVVNPQSDEALSLTARQIIVPLMASMAELIGYDDLAHADAEFDEEGRLTEATVKRRERSPRNRLLCLSIHGRRCAVCGFSPGDLYGLAGDIIEVHHIEPVGQLIAPRPYDPAIDLIPLCPNCHRAVHTRRPEPFLPEELRSLLRL
jgi:5-methylcytosine-specific restriction protein A